MMTKKYSFFILLIVTTMFVLRTQAHPTLFRTLHYSTHEGMASNAVNTIMQDRQGYLWMGTNVGLTRYDGHRFVNFYRSDGGQRVVENVVNIVEDSTTNALLVLTSSRYQVYAFSLEQMCFVETGEADSTLVSRFKLLDSTPAHAQETAQLAKLRGISCKNGTQRKDAVRYVVLPDKNEVWVTTDNGFYVYNKHSNTTKHFTSSDPDQLIDSDFMTDILVDHSGCVWMTNGITGLYQLLVEPRNVFHHHISDASAIERSVRSFSIAADGRLLVSNMNGDVYRYNLETNHRELLMHKEHRVYATMTDFKERLWIATRGDGVWVNHRHLNETDSLTAKIIFHLYQSCDGTIWISTLDKGLVRVEEQPNGRFRFNYYMKEERVHQVDIDKKGQLWVATENGIFLGNGNEFRQVYNGVKVVSICCTDDNRVLAATIGNGLLIIDNEKSISLITTTNGLTNDCVKAVAWDESIGIVAATDAGVTVITPYGETHSIYSTEGMMADNYNENAVLRLSDGRIVFGNLNGFLELRRDSTHTVPALIPSPTITSIIEDGVPCYQQQFKRLVLPYNQNNLVFTYSCFDYDEQSSIIYSYMMEGVSDNWQPSTNETSVLYNNMHPGHYRFRLRAARAGQAYGDETICDIIISQPWWWTWWARSAYLIVIVLLFLYEWHQYHQRLSLRRQLDQRLTALYAFTLAKSSEESKPAKSIVPHTDEKKVTRETTNREQDIEQIRKVADRDFLEKLDEIILPNLIQQDFDIAFIAEKMCMSHSTFYRRIKSLTGMTANEYVRKHRLAKAMQLLREGHNVSEVAMQCGFNSPSYFARCFKAEYGILPSEV